MASVFKITATTPQPKPTIGDTNFKNHYPDVNRATPYAEIEPYIRQATNLYILPFIGETMYEKLAANYNDNTIPDEAKKLLELIQDAIAYYTIYHALPQKAVAIASMGIQQNTPTEGTARPLGLGEVKNLKWSIHLTADAMLDKVLAHLEVQTDTYFDDWKESKAYKVKTSTLFRRTEELDEYLNIQNSRRAFIALIIYMRQAEQDDLIEIIGETLFDKLNDDTDELKKLKTICQKFIAQAGFVNAIPNLTLITEADGFTIVSKGDGIEERNGLKSQQHENAILRLLQKAQENTARYRTALIEFLYKNKNVYTDWIESDYYKNLATKGEDVKIITSTEGAIML